MRHGVRNRRQSSDGFECSIRNSSGNLSANGGGGTVAKQALDRRARRTRALLQQAHLELILKKGYDATTIQDICDAADVGRSTFYAHYRSKDDLRRSGFEHLRTLLAERQASALASTAEGDERRLAFSLTLFEHAR